MIDKLLMELSNIISNNIYIAPIIALIAGIFTSFTPCSLSTIPLIIACIGGSSANNLKKSLKLSCVFAIGLSVTFTSFGVAASLLGKILGMANSWWYIVLGIIMLIMTLQIFGIFEFIPSTYLVSKNTKTGYIGAFVGGVLGGIFSSPCATPVLVVLLAFVAKEGNVLFGAFLLLMYALGNSFLVIVSGSCTGFIRGMIKSKNYGLISAILKYVSGVLIVLLSLYMFYLGF